MDVRKFGYIRMSSKDQNEGRQLQAYRMVRSIDPVVWL